MLMETMTKHTTSLLIVFCLLALTGQGFAAELPTVEEVLRGFSPDSMLYIGRD
jgi:hypothetical protein